MNWFSFVLGYLAAFLTLGLAVWLGHLLAKRAEQGNGHTAAALDSAPTVQPLGPLHHIGVEGGQHLGHFLDCQKCHDRIERLRAKR